MQTTIKKKGDNYGICIPNSYLRKLNWRENDSIDVVLQKDAIIVQKSKLGEKKTAALDQLKSLRVHVDDFDSDKERTTYLEEKYNL